jgi:hypothetical protein
MTATKQASRSRLEWAAALSLFCGLALPAEALAAQRINPAQAERQARDANRDARQATQNLEQNANSGIRNLQRLTRDAGKLENDLKSAKRAADKVREATDKLADAAQRCDENDFARFSKQARDAAEDYERQKDRAENTELDLLKDIKDTMDAVNNRVSDAQKTIDAGFKAARDAGLADNSVTVGNLATAQQMLNNELAELNSPGTKAKDFKDEGSLHKLNKAKSEFDGKLKQIKDDNSPGDVPNVEQKITEWDAYMKERCRKVSQAPKEPTDFYASVDNRPEQVACVDRLMSDQEVANLFGDLGGGKLLAAKDSGTVFKTVANTQTIERTLASRGLKPCFAPEPNYCTIMTPLTAFRGHDHAHHHGHPHEHDAPDPPLSWGLHPPDIVIRLGARR